jgi:hypothetical protein
MREPVGSHTIKQPHLSYALHWRLYCEHTVPPVFFAHFGKHIPLIHQPAPDGVSWQALLPLQLDTQWPWTQLCPERVQSLFALHLERSSVGFRLHVPAPSQDPVPPLQEVPDVSASVPQTPLRQVFLLHSDGVPPQSDAELHSAVQSLSSFLSAFDGQQPSLLTREVTVIGMQLTLQDAGDPTSFS